MTIMMMMMILMMTRNRVNMGFMGQVFPRLPPGLSAPVTGNCSVSS
jgi:hypothetical protein